MPRTDNHGKQLHALLGYLLDGGVDSRDIYGALGISRSTYYRRIREPDYPNAEELRQVATRFGFSSADFQVRFGLLSPEDVAIYTDSRHPGHHSHSAMAPGQIPAALDHQPPTASLLNPSASAALGVAPTPAVRTPTAR